MSQQHSSTIQNDINANLYDINRLESNLAHIALLQGATIFFITTHYAKEVHDTVGQIRITPDQMRTRAGEFRTEGNNFQDCITKMQGLIRTLQEEWEGQASQVFAAQFEALTPSFNKVRELIEDIGGQLDATAAAVESLDQESAGKFNI
jgi:WXG100 family type VII secretion target